MIITTSERYNHSLKKIKKKYQELCNLNIIINHISNCSNADILKMHPYSMMYGFERLKYYNDYYSFNINKNGGKCRLLFRIENEQVILEYISTNHYEDFKRGEKNV